MYYYSFMDILKDVVLKYIKYNYSTGQYVYHGTKNNNELFFLIRSMPNNIDFEQYKFFTKTFDNARYTKYKGQSLDNQEITIIYPATKEDTYKYGQISIYKTLETYETYRTLVYPNIINQDISWIYNILNKKCNTENILYQDDSFMLLPDLKWDGSLDTMYCLAIVGHTYKNIKSIRDLNNNHILLLEHINKKSCETIKQKYNIETDQIRSYFHYHPSFWHLHIHFNLITNNLSGAIVDVSHTLINVINNLKIDGDYYKKINLEVINKTNI